MSRNKEVMKRIATEKAVIRAFVKSALADGCLISVYDGEAYALKKSDNITAIMKALMSTDEDRLFVWKDGVKIGRVFLVYGNDGYDVICDYSISLEYLMPVVRAAEEKAEREVA